MKRITSIPSFTTPVLVLVIIASLLLILEPHFLWKLQESNLFLNSKVFFDELMVEPGGLLSWVGTWFTQFFFHPWVGVLMLCGWWLLLMWMVRKTFCVGSRWMPVVVVPVLFLLVTIVGMGYWIYILKLRGHAFVGTIGTTAAVALLWAFRSVVERVRLRPTLVRCVFVLLTCAVGYPLLGIYGLAAAVLMSLWIWRLEPRRLSALAVSLTGLLCVGLLPLFFYRYVYYQTNIANIFFAKLPLYYVTERYTSFYVPFILLLLFFVVMVFLPQRTKGEKANGLIGQAQGAGSPDARAEKTAPRGKRQKADKRLSRNALQETLAAVLLLLVAAVYTACSWYRDENFHHEVAMQRCIDRLDWEGVLKEAAKQKDEPTRAIAMMRNLALARLGRQGDEMCHYRNGCKKCNAPFDIRAVNSVGALIYYHYGMPNYSYRLCMERGVEFGWRVEQLKYLARCSILSGEQQLAHKYLGLLKQTLFHGTWADSMHTLAEKRVALVASPEMGFITHMMHYDENLTSDHNLVEDFLMRQLMSASYTGDPLFVEQALFATLWAKDTKEFWNHLYNYTRLYPDRQWPVHVQEAAMMFGTLDHKKQMDQWPISSSVRENYKRFDQMAERLEGADWKKANTALYKLFGQTYFYDCYMINFPSQN
ncbi:MAG: hypothetical protein IK000_08040 [Bacteroidaceae bacterium]|nr:hypothetical protein [Bacteroidaceae bacterium]